MDVDRCFSYRANPAGQDQPPGVCGLSLLIGGATLVFESTPLKSPLKLSLARVLVFENKHPSWGFS